MTLRCVIFDDCSDVLRAASELLEGDGIAVVGVATTGAEPIRPVERLEPDVTLLDIDLGQESGFDLARRIGHTRAGARSHRIGRRGGFRDPDRDQPGDRLLAQDRSVR